MMSLRQALTACLAALALALELGMLPAAHAIVPPSSVPRWATTQAPAPAEQLFTSMSKQNGTGFRVYHNVWWHNQRFYAVLPPELMDDPWHLDDGLSVGQVFVRVPVRDMQAYLDVTRLSFVRGTTLLVDYPFMQLPNHLSHWAEIMVPTYSALREGQWGRMVRRGEGAKQGDAPKLDNVLMPNLNQDVNPWFKALLSVACAPGLTGTARTLPTFVDYAELYKYDSLAWIMFENVLAIDDRYTHPQGKRGFISIDHGHLWRHDNCHRWVSETVATQFAKPSHGQEFREAVWALEPHIGEPAAWTPGTPPPLPRTITLLLPADEEWAGIVNAEELTTALDEVAKEHGMETRVMSVAAGASLGTHLDAVARSGVLVGRHAPVMASSMLMPPGGMVLELMPYKWEWANISMLHYNITQSLGDIHHFAWRPTHHKWAQFKNYSDVRYYPWTPVECESYECLNKLRHAGLIADIPAVKGILRSKLPGVLKGMPVSQLKEPWPEAV